MKTLVCVALGVAAVGAVYYIGIVRRMQVNWKNSGDPLILHRGGLNVGGILPTERPMKASGE